MPTKDPENGGLSYGLSAPPPGMVIDVTTRVITWNPTAVGNPTITVTVTDAFGATVQQIYSLNVLATGDPQGNRPPVISSNPIFLADPT